MLISELYALAKNSSIRILVTSRREADIIQYLERVQNLSIGSEDTQNDIQAYLEYQISQNPKLSNGLVRSRIRRILSIRSNGMFLWVVLMLEELKFKQTVMEIEDMLSSPLPRDLYGVYEHILLRLNTALKPSQKTLCQKVLRWAALAKRPLQINEIEEALEFEYNMDKHDTLLTDSTILERELQMICGSLITFRSRSIQLMHLSTRDFLLTKQDVTKPTAAFFVTLGRESTQIARICVSYVSAFSKPKTVGVAQSDGRKIGTRKTFMRYACLNWLTHIVESYHEAIFELEPTLLPFLTTQKSLIWIELCLSLDFDYFSQLIMDFQSLIYWSSPDSFRGLEGKYKKSIARLNFWASSCLNMLIEYGSVLRHRPCEIHFIDPRCIFPPSEWRMDEIISTNAVFHRHLLLKQDDLSNNQPCVLQYPAHRSLQRNTSQSFDYALFYLHESNNAFVTVDRDAGSLPRLHCQHATSGRRLPPISDTEFGDKIENLKVLIANKSSDGSYVGIVYMLRNGFGKITYFAIWRIHEGLDFEETRPQPWAHKVSSNLITSVGGVNQVQPIIFDEDHRVYSPSGCLNLKTGVEEYSFDHFRRGSIWDISFSGNGSTMLRCESFGLCDRGIIEVLSSSGAWEAIVKFTHSTRGTLMAVSHSGRFIIYFQFEMFEEPTYHETRTLFIFDIKLQAAMELAKLDTIDCIRAAFYNNDCLIVCFIGVRTLDGPKTHVKIFRTFGIKYRLCATRVLTGRLAGNYFDESSQHLYVVSQDRVWARLDVASENLASIDSFAEVSFNHWAHYQISADGRWLVLVQKDEDEGQ